MKIEAVTVRNLHFDYPGAEGFRYAGGVVTSRVTSLVEISTDAGLTGIGAAYSHPDLVRLIIERHLAPHLRGRDPSDVEDLWELLYGLTRWYGRKGVAISALGGIDIALWDLRGKQAGKPVYELLGGTRSHAPAYASGLFWQDDISLLEAEAATHIDNGYRRVKMRLGRDADYDVAAVEAVRRAIGPDNDVLVDGSHRYTSETAAWFGKQLERVGAFWFEEPFPPEELDMYVELRRKLNVPLAAGENEFGVQGFRELLRAGAVGIAQPDACRTGGITECLRIGKLAQSFGVGVATHTWSDAIALVANAHVVAALPNGITVEVDQTGNAFIDAILSEPLAIRDGLLQLGDEPGLGISLDRTVVESLTLAPSETMRDGNYSDLIFSGEYLTTAPPYARSG